MHRDRLRWTVEQDLNLRIGPNDDVEIWCCGSNVPGAWLEAKVRGAVDVVDDAVCL